VKTVCFTVDLLVTVFVNVTRSVLVSKGVQETCLSCGTALRTTGATTALLVPVVLGGLYENAQSVSSSSVALSVLVTVRGMQVKSLASSGSEISVTTNFTVDMVVVVLVVVAVTMAGGHGEQKPSEPQYPIDLQHSF
jgi:hypothetical protein